MAVLVLVGAYLIGSLDFAVVVGRMHGVDIFETGSGNPGTANVLRTLGRGPAAMVLVGDLLKGVIAAAIGMVVSNDPHSALTIGAGLAAVIGHCYPVFHRFRGGKGVATALGVVLLAMPTVGLGLAGLWIVVVLLTRVSALGSLALAVAAVPAAAVWGSLRDLALALLGGMFLLVVLRHSDNIRRLIRGEERSISRS